MAVRTMRINAKKRRRIRRRILPLCSVFLLEFVHLHEASAFTSCISPALPPRSRRTPSRTHALHASGKQRRPMNSLATASDIPDEGTSMNTSAGMSMWQILNTNHPTEAWKTIFGEHGERGEYMDGYSARAMADRCAEDYKWTEKFSPDAFDSERADMMSHLYDNAKLWTHVSSVAFAEHYIPVTDGDAEEAAIAKPFHTFRKQQDSRRRERPIFGGVVPSDWDAYGEKDIERKLAAFKKKGIDYVRLECNFGSVDDIEGPAQLADDPRFRERFRRLARTARACQKQQMVPLVLIQVPWREPGGDSNEYFERAVKSFAAASKNAGVESKQLLLETRPPVGLSASEEKGLRGTERISLGLETGREMFEVIHEAFDGQTIAGFCVAGGSTKGDLPMAMEDDTQNAVRRGMRRCAQRQWGYEVCFWEMGAKLMLQPKVGRLWGTNTQSGRDAARELFCVNAQDLADEIKAGI